MSSWIVDASIGTESSAISWSSVEIFAVAAQEKVSQVEPCSVYILNRNDDIL